MKEGDIVFWEESNYLGYRLEKVTVTKVSSNFATVKTTRGNEKKFNLKTMHDVGRQYGREYTGALRYELILPTAEIEHKFAIQSRRGEIKEIVARLSRICVEKLTEQQVNEYHSKLQSLKTQGSDVVK